MKLGSFEALVHALDGAGVRYLVAGGLAVNAHGYLRFTRDVDLVVQLSPENIASAFSALERIGYRPIVAVTARPGCGAIRLDSIAHPDEGNRRPAAG